MAKIRRRLKRYEGLNHARYLTCSCYRCLPLFGNESIKDAFVEHLCFVQRVMGFDLFAWVIMPEHFHLLLRPASSPKPHTASSGMLCGTHQPDKASSQDVTQILRRLKSPFGKQVVARWRELHAPILPRITDSRATQRFWQTGGGYDRNIFSDDEFFEKIQYIHANPIRRGLVECATDYPWSSARFYEGQTYEGPTIKSIS